MKMLQKNVGKILMVLLIVSGLFLFFFLDLQNYLTLEYLKNSKVALLSLNETNPFLTMGIYIVIYIASTAFSLPGAIVLTLAGGTLFGVVKGTIAISFASTIGATLAMMVARTVLRDFVQNKFENQVKAINQKIETEGAFYLFTLRLVPLFPFFVINLVMGLTSMKVFTFAWVSQIGMFAGTIIYVNAGAELGKIQSLKDILSPSLLISLILLGILPLALKKLVDFLVKKQDARKT